jgi:hypothetical protein
MRWNILGPTLLSVSLVASSAVAQNLINNGTFNSNISDWSSLDSDVALAWTANDADGSPTSGSLQATNNSPTALDSGFVQCVDGLTAGVNYNFGVKMLIPSSNPPGQSTLQIQWNDAAGCTGDFLRAEIMESEIFDAWAAVSGSHVAPAGTKSAVIFGEVLKNSNTAAAYQTSYDDIFLEPTSTSSPCTPSSTTLCIDDQPGDKRFQITASWRDPSVTGGGGSGHAVSLATLGLVHGGVFWFFSSDNPEILIKVLNGCAVNSFHWVFFDAGTNVGFTVTVTDTTTGIAREYINHLNNPAPPVQDTSAFACP